MIYTVSFTFKEGAGDSQELKQAYRFFGDLKDRGLIEGCRILKDQKNATNSGGGRYLALVEFRDTEALGFGMKAVAAIGYQAGLHGAMIASVDEFSVGFWDTIEEL